MNRFNGFIAATLMTLSATANASTVIPTLEIDFRTSDWSGAFWQNSYSYDGVTISALPTSKNIYQDSMDGIGVLSGEYDEINPGEMMDITFDYANSWASAVTGLWITDLFPAPDGGIRGEEGLVSLTLSDGSVIDYSFFGENSDPTSTNGEQFISFGSALKVVKANFKTNGVAGNEFSIAGFSAIPEASSLGLLAMGLLAIGGFANRRKKV